MELVISEDFLFTIVYNGATGTIELKWCPNKDDLEIIKLMKIDSKKIKILKNKLIGFVFKIKNIENFELNMEV